MYSLYHIILTMIAGPCNRRRQLKPLYEVYYVPKSTIQSYKCEVLQLG